MTEVKPIYYVGGTTDLFEKFEMGLITEDEVRGFYKGNVIKYLTRYQNKNGIEDLEKAQTYLGQLTKFELRFVADPEPKETGDN